MTQSGFNITDLVREAQTRWLKPVEVLSILQNYNEDQLTHQSVQKPASGSLFLFNKRVLRFFRKDGHNWRKKKDGRTVGEAHERLKVGNVEALNCYYAHGEQNPNFQRRSYWILDPAHEHIVLVHYREIAELQGKPNSGTVSQLSPGSLLTYDQSPSSYTSQYPGTTSVIGEQYEPYQSPGGSLEVNSDIVVNSNGINMVDTQEINDEINVNQALRKLELQLSLNDESVEKFQNFYSENDNSNDLEDAINNNNRAGILPDDLQDLGLLQVTGGNGELNHQTGPQEFAAESEDSFYWNDMFDTFQSSPNLGFENRDKSEYVPQDLENFNFTAYSPVTNSTCTYPNSFSPAFDQGQLGMNFEADSSLTISPNQKYTIREICPESGYASETTKVVIVGSFLCDPSIDTWTCMIGDVEVPAQIIQEGVLCCQAPPHLPGKVSLCITSNNRVSCSEIREFEYHVSRNTCTNCNSFQSEGSKSADEMLLLVRFVQMLLFQKSELSELGCYISDKSKSSEESWNHVIEALLFGTWTLSSTTDWLLQELLKDKLQVWLSSKSENGYDYQNYSLSKNEQGIIHMVAGLGYDWALDLILNSGVNINFRDINGWTGLHWAARFGREKMVAALLASGASAGVVTDPNSNDPIGQTPASIAATFGHKGLAGYLSEIALTSHLHSLTLQESKLANDSADIEAENAVNTFSQSSLLENDDQLSLKDTLAAVRNTAQAAARIQAAFRAHSFRKRNERETMSGYDDLDEYVVSSNDIRDISVASRMAFGPAREYNTAALSIQKKYRGWKGRKDYLSLRQKVVKIQAHFRGHQARKQYQVCWAVGILEKVVLRWRRKGVGLRGFRPEMESIDDSEDDDILKVFRKQKVDGAVDEAVSRVLFMVESPDARQQYRRMLERFRQAKAERESIESEGSSTSHHDFFYMENEDRPQYQ